tara:strand:- start:12570 stop:13058 length:489 start_codon:yes stop_codon:yes gene_type:complete
LISDLDKTYLRRCVDLARAAVDSGDEPFGSILVSGQGEILMEDHNHVAGGDHTRHPEFAIARWAANNMTIDERRQATVYTSGEHCPMCAAAHGWVELGRIVYAASSKQLVEWLTEFGASPPRVKALPIGDIITDTVIEGPVADFAEEIKSLHALSHKGRAKV